MEPEQEGLRVNHVLRAGLAEDVISGKTLEEEHSTERESDSS